jgi:DNA repair photolyase
VIKEIRARTLVSRVQGLDTYFGLDYGMNLYRGCQHRCIYCDSRSLCYGIEAFDRDVLIKVNAIDLLEHELCRKRKKGVIGTGSMNDPYMPLEADVRLTQRALEVIAAYGFGVHVVTKSDLVLRDLALLQRIGRTASAAVSLTITTVDDELSKRIEPGAPPSSARFGALAELASAGIETRVALMPTLPFIEDTWDNVSAIVERAHVCGVTAIVPWFGMSMRDRQRAYFYRQLDRLFPGLRAQYESRYGEDYMCPSPQANVLFERFCARCSELRIATSVQPSLAPTGRQLDLFESD